MKLVPGGSFRMGSDPEELDDIAAATGLRSTKPLLPETPSHEVSVADFFLDTFIVNNQQYHEFVQAAPEWRKSRLDPSQHNGRYLEHWDGGQPPEALHMHPVTFVTWHSAAAYCKWRNKRLPSEIEFEWAARNGESATQYPWGDTPPADKLVNWGGDRRRSTSPVGNYPPNEFGLYDMAGNVWQFTADPWLGSYGDMLELETLPEELTRDPNFRRVVRGGSWGANAANLRAKYRDSHRPFNAREMVGFRCAKSIEAL